MKKLATYKEETEAMVAEQVATTKRTRSPRYVLGDTLELTGTSYFPARLNEKGKPVPAVYSGWVDDELFRILGDDADALNEVAPAWREGDVKHVDRGGQIVVLGTKAGKSCRLQEPGDEQDFIESYSLNAGHLTGEVDIIGANPVKFVRKASNG